MTSKDIVEDLLGLKLFWRKAQKGNFIPTIGDCEQVAQYVDKAADEIEELRDQIKGLEKAAEAAFNEGYQEAKARGRWRPACG